MVAIWLVPSLEDRERLKTIMKPPPPSPPAANKLAKSSYPKIEPHVTLASVPASVSDEIRDILERLIATTRSVDGLVRGMRIKFASVEVGAHYFRSVYVAVEPTREIVGLHEVLHGLLRVEPRTPSFPHFSLCYVADEDGEGERRRFERGLRESGRVVDYVRVEESEGEGEVERRRVKLQVASGGEGDGEGVVWVDGWTVAEIWLVECVGPVEEWRVLDTFPL